VSISASGFLKGSSAIARHKEYCKAAARATLHNKVRDSVTIEISHNHTGGGSADIRNSLRTSIRESAVSTIEEDET
jgi:hypothetical protein